MTPPPSVLHAHRAGVVTSRAARPRAHPQNMDVQLFGTRSLIGMADCEANVLSIARSGGLEVVVNNLKNTQGAPASKKNRDVVLSSMWLLSALSLVDAVKTMLHTGGMVPTILSSVAEYSKDEEVSGVGRELVEAVVDAATVMDTVHEMTASLSATMVSPSDTRALEVAIARAAAFSICPQFAEQMVRSDGVTELVRVLNEMTKVKKCERLETVLTCASAALVQIARSTQSVDELRHLMAKSGVVTAAISSVKEHPKLTDHVKAAVSFLESYAQMPECAQEISEGGGVEACVCALRANENDEAVVRSTTNTLLQLAAGARGAVAVARLGGTRQVISTIMANAGTPGFAVPMANMLSLLQRVSITSEGQDVLVKQGGVDAVIAASDCIAKGGGATGGVASKVLSKLLTRDDVAHAVHAANLAVAIPMLPQHTEELNHAMSRVGHMCVVGSNAEAIVRDGGAASVAAVATALLREDTPLEMQQAVLPVALQVCACVYMWLCVCVCAACVFEHDAESPRTCARGHLINRTSCAPGAREPRARHGPAPVVGRGWHARAVPLQGHRCRGVPRRADGHGEDGGGRAESARGAGPAGPRAGGAGGVQARRAHVVAVLHRACCARGAPLDIAACRIAAQGGAPRRGVDRRQHGPRGARGALPRRDAHVQPRWVPRVRSAAALGGLRRHH